MNTNRQVERVNELSVYNDDLHSQNGGDLSSSRQFMLEDNERRIVEEKNLLIDSANIGHLDDESLKKDTTDFSLSFPGNDKDQH